MVSPIERHYGMDGGFEKVSSVLARAQETRFRFFDEPCVCDRVSVFTYSAHIMNIKLSVIVLAIAVLAMAGLCSAAHHKRDESDLSKACKKAYDDVQMSFEEGAAGKAGCTQPAFEYFSIFSMSAEEVETMEADYCESDGACAKVIDAGIASLEAACMEELDYTNDETSNFFIIDFLYGALKGHKSYLCLSDGDGNNCALDGEQYVIDSTLAFVAAKNEDVEAFCERDGCAGDVFAAYIDNTEIIQEYEHSIYYNYKRLQQLSTERVCGKSGSTYCLYEISVANETWTEASAPDNLPKADDENVKDDDVTSFYDAFDAQCSTCMFKNMEIINEIASLVGGTAIDLSHCATDGNGGYCFLKRAQYSTSVFGAAIACPVGDSECEAFQNNRDADDVADCDAEFPVDVANTQKCSKACKAIIPPVVEYMGCCVSATWRNSFTARRRLIDGVSFLATHMEAKAYFNDCGAVYDYESRCEPRVFTRFRIAMRGLDISEATEKEIEALVALIVEDVAAYANVNEDDVMVTVTDLGDGATDVEVVITVDNEAASSTMTATVSRIDEDDFQETKNSELVSNDGLEVDEVAGGSFSGVAALVPTAFAVLCALVALLF
jgi:hypothetical protein